MWGAFIAGLLIAGAAAAVSTWVLLRRQLEFREYVAATVQGVLLDRHRSLDDTPDDTEDLSVLSTSDLGTAESIDRAAKMLRERVARLSQERDVLRHILHSMTTGVVYIAHGGRIRMVNEAAERMFRRPMEQWIDRDHWTLFRQYNLCAAIDNALLFGTTWHNELSLRDDLMVDIRLIALPVDAQLTVGVTSVFDVLLICNDVSEWRRLERMRSEFVANVSHELKTPIAAIRGFAETLLDGDVDAESQHSFLQTIYDESYRMGNLVSDLLELSKLEGEAHAIQPSSVDLAAVVDRAIQRLRGEAEKRNIHLEAVQGRDVTVWADEDKLLQVVLNLMTNAIHYTSEGGHISVRCDVLVDRVKVHVEDSGIGVSAEHQSRVFERFYRVDRDRSRASGGTGLGLAIVKHIIGAHGGQVGVTSAPGHGSDFWFTLSRLEGAIPESSS